MAEERKVVVKGAKVTAGNQRSGDKDTTKTDSGPDLGPAGKDLPSYKAASAPATQETD
jgi:hypothetical protein